MDETNIVDQNSAVLAEQTLNSQELHSNCSKDDMLQNTGTKKRIRPRKLRSEMTQDNKIDITSGLSAVKTENSKVENCASNSQTLECSMNAVGVPHETAEASSHVSPKKNVRKRGKKQPVKSDKLLTKDLKYCMSQSTPGKSNQKVPPPPIAGNCGNGLWGGRKRNVSNSLDSNFPLDHSSKDYNKSNKDNGKTLSQRNRNQSFSDEDSFEEYLAPNLVEGLLQLPNYLKGVIRINQKMYTEAYISEPSGKRDILIEGIRNRNRALEGDEVVVAILPVSEWKEIPPNEIQRTGKVIYLLKAVHSRQAIGLLKPMPQTNSLQALFSPRDSRVPRMRVPVQECPPDFEKMSNHLFCARIVKWDNVRFARGGLVGGSVGIQGDIDAETNSILLEYGIRSEPYPPELIPKFSRKLQKQDFENREDLRKECIFSIDPVTARDLDDAVSCVVLENGNYLIGVHISDVSYYLQEGTPLDQLVCETATTTYLVQSVYHMLPREMTMMCSLLPGEDKLSFSVFWELEETETDVKVVSHRFTRSVMNSCAQLAYEHAQVMLENPDKKWDPSELPTIHNGFTPGQLSSIVCTLNRLAIKMRNKRFESGSLRIDQTKLCFSLDKDGLPLDMTTYENKESHRLIEEFMLLANITVATALHGAFPRIAFLRQHSPPMGLMMEKLCKQLELSDITIDYSSSKAMQQSLAAYKDDNTTEGVARFLALNCLFSKPMARAKYFCLASANKEEDVCHFALSVPIYTHFTSPIRRYADVMVHRLLSAYLRYSSVPSWTEDFVSGVAANCNARKYSAKKAGEQSSELFLALHLKNNGPMEGSAVVVDVKDHSFDALFCSTGTTVRIYSDKIGAEVHTVKVNNVFSLLLVWPRDKSRPVRQQISLFSVVNIELKCSTTATLKIEPVLLPPWAELRPANRSEIEVNGTSPEVCNIDLSNIKLPDILDDVQEALDTSDEDLPSPESECESPTPVDSKELKNITMIKSDCRRM